MLVREFSKLFFLLAQNAKLHGNTSAASDFEVAASALGAQRVGLSVKDAVNFWQTTSAVEPTHTSETAMTARNAANYLRLVSDVSQVVSPKRGPGPLLEVISFLEAKGDVSVRDVFAPRVPPTMDYAALLAQAGMDRRAFESAIRQLQKDKSLSPEELQQIVAGYTGSSRRFKSKKAAIESALEHFEIEIQYAAKAAAIDRLTSSS